ncbi:MAG: HEAT repeat domain-containing protein [Propionicimonas sp.]
MSRTWRIGEVSQRTGLTRRTLRHYDDLGLLTPSARSWGDYRLYDEDDLVRLLQIQNLKALGLSLPEITLALEDSSLDAAATLRSHLAHLEERIAAEQVLARRLASLADAAERSWQDVLEAIALTRQLGHPDPTVRLRAALRPPVQSTSELLDTLQAETDPAIREVLVWALAQQPEAAEAALARIDDPDPELRWWLVRLLGKLRDPITASALVARLDDPEPRVVAAAVTALGRWRPESALPALVALLDTQAGDSADLREAIAGYGETAVPPVSVLLRARSATTRARAAEVLGAVGSVAALPVLSSALADSDQQVRLTSLIALGELAEAARPAVESMAGDPELGKVARRLLELHAT